MNNLSKKNSFFSSIKEYIMKKLINKYEIMVIDNDIYSSSDHESYVTTLLHNFGTPERIPSDIYYRANLIIKNGEIMKDRYNIVNIIPIKYLAKYLSY